MMPSYLRNPATFYAPVAVVFWIFDRLSQSHFIIATSATHDPPRLHVFS